MSMEEATKHTISAAATVTTPAFYLTDVSTEITIAVGIASLIWFAILFWEKFFPEHFKNFVRMINRRKQ